LPELRSEDELLEFGPGQEYQSDELRFYSVSSAVMRNNAKLHRRDAECAEHAEDKTFENPYF
jgi:hypothetical protein